MSPLAQRRIVNVRKLTSLQRQMAWLKFQQSTIAKVIYRRHAMELRAAFLTWSKTE